jgi:hypothetical protein
VSKRLAQLAVIAVVVAAAFWFRARERLPESPEAAVNELFDAAARGDDAAYLRLLGGELRKTLESSREQLGATAFRESLRRSAAGIKGLAVSRGEQAPPDRVALDLDLVFADRNERQRMLLVDTGRGFMIVALDGATMVKPPVAYGTPVYDEGAVPPVAPANPGGGNTK